MGRDYFDILGVSRNVTKEELRQAYRKMALKHHPDRNPGDQAAETRFKEVAEAYAVLSDDEKREIYERYGEAGLKGRGNGDPFGGMDDIFSQFGDVFGDFFGFGGRSSRGGRARRGEDQVVRVRITLAEAAQGINKKLKFRIKETCPHCMGRGTAPGYAPETCSRCGGTGQVRQTHGFFTIAQTCPVCGGAGRVIRERCEYCNGAGTAEVKRELDVDIPAGVSSGDALKVPFQGHEGSNGVQAGDLYVKVEVQPDPRFERQGADLIMRIDLSVPQAVLGGNVMISTLYGEKNINIKPGIQPGDVLTLKGYGMPVIGHRGKGNLYCTINVNVPKKLSRKEKKLYQQLLEID